MQEKVYFTFFILCAILSHEILAKFLKKSVEESSKLLARQKRVIDRSPGGDQPVWQGGAAYVVNLKKNRRLHCVATILSRRTAITAAECVQSSDIWIYTVHSGTTYTYRGNEHNVTERKMHGHNPSRSSLFLTGIALITVTPPFEYSVHTTNIRLHSGPIVENMEATVFGWGTRVSAGRVETEHPQKLRYIVVPIMNQRACRQIYRPYFELTEEDICTYHAQKLCGDTDSGAPLVIDNELVGVHMGGILLRGAHCPISPDVFVSLQHRNYGPWIERNIV